MKKFFAIFIVIVILLLSLGGGWLYKMTQSSYQGKEIKTIIIPKNSSNKSFKDSLINNLGNYGQDVYYLWKLRKGDSNHSAGVYFVYPGEKAWNISSQIKNGRSSTVKVTFNNIRHFNELAGNIASKFLWTPSDFIIACDSILQENGFNKSEYPAAFLPDTYEFYASAEPEDVVKKLLDIRNNFWTEERRAKAKTLGLTPVEVATVASIVEEESNNKDERPIIARLYINRLHKGMRLQADPTVKYALGDFSIRRLSEQHTRYKSPYNTYYIKGLPPGPIRIPEKSTLDAVLDCPENDYIYMCAKPDRSGTHNFATNYDEHLHNARQYHQWLESIGIKL